MHTVTEHTSILRSAKSPPNVTGENPKISTYAGNFLFTCRAIFLAQLRIKKFQYLHLKVNLHVSTGNSRAQDIASLYEETNARKGDIRPIITPFHAKQYILIYTARARNSNTYRKNTNHAGFLRAWATLESHASPNYRAGFSTGKISLRIYIRV